ncbi:hypothetical protein [uncultured Alistipes sp.]|uniref:hypothetical protein n=1 Tax=uncultured Alistipes sp. TaxID=538949 RepID=UPI002631E5F3|nr:hypothetical protein [uncultured Alistipes sp.]
MKRMPDAERVVLRAVIAAAGLRAAGFFRSGRRPDVERTALRGFSAAGFTGGRFFSVSGGENAAARAIKKVRGQLPANLFS